MILKNHTIPLKDKFWYRVKKTRGCWFWTGAKDRDGYGRILEMNKGKRKLIFAHRASWILHYGDILNNLHVLHHCDNTSCVKPKHLYLGTHQDNMRDMKTRGRANCPELRGKNNPMYGRTGKNNPFYGKHHTKETKRILSEKAKQRRVIK